MKASRGLFSCVQLSWEFSVTEELATLMPVTWTTTDAGLYEVLQGSHSLLTSSWAGERQSSKHGWAEQLRVFTYHDDVLNTTDGKLMTLSFLIRYSDSLRSCRHGDRIPVGGEISAPVQTGPRAHIASCTMGTLSFPRGVSGWDVELTTHDHLVSRWKKIRVTLLSLHGLF